ncbi:MAG TPA: hypothetical protein VGF87_09475 [Acidimicrobiales bacterium]
MVTVAPGAFVVAVVPDTCVVAVPEDGFVVSGAERGDGLDVQPATTSAVATKTAPPRSSMEADTLAPDP